MCQDKEETVFVRQNSDSEAVDYLDAEKAALRGAMGAKSIASIEDAVRQYDFEAALDLLKEEAAKANIKFSKPS